jgi:hypothetical protein
MACNTHVQIINVYKILAGKTLRNKPSRMLRFRDGNGSRNAFIELSSLTEDWGVRLTPGFVDRSLTYAITRLMVLHS